MGSVQTFVFFFFHGATSSSRPRHPNYQGFTITLRHTTLGTCPLEEWSAHRRDLYLTTHNTHDNHATGAIRTRNPSKPAAADSRLRPHGHWDQLNICGYVWHICTMCTDESLTNRPVVFTVPAGLKTWTVGRRQVSTVSLSQNLLHVPHKFTCAPQLRTWRANTSNIPTNGMEQF